MANNKVSTIHLLLRAPLIFLVIGILAFFSGVMRWLFPTSISEIQTFPMAILVGAVIIGIGLFLFFYRRKKYLSDIYNKEAERASEYAERQKNIIRRAISLSEIPDEIDGNPLAYQYLNIDFTPVLPPPSDENILRTFLLDSELSFSILGDKAVLSHNGTTIGEFSYKLDMISDFLSRSDIVKVFLSKWDMSGAKIHLCFYCDQQKPFYGRPSEIVRLMEFTDDSAQKILTNIAYGSKLDYDEDYNREGKYFVSHYFGTIGYLPSAVVKKLSTTDIDAIFLDRFEVDKEKNLLIPYVRIYWSQN